MDVSNLISNETAQTIALIFGSGLAGVIGTYLVNNVLLSDGNLKHNADRLDDIIDDIQKNNKSIGKSLRTRLIKQFELGVKYLKEDDGIN